MKLYNTFLQEIQRSFLELNLEGNPDTLYQPIRYTLEDGGKRMRPLLTLLSASLFNSDLQEVVRKAMLPALAIEVFHNFTLLHDDIMDCAPTRRGRPTVHTKWGTNGAILSGDAMMILSYHVLCGADRLPEQMAVFNRAAIEVCEGQQLDMEFEDRVEVSVEEYIEMIRLKTAALMAAATKMGAIAMDATTEQCDALYRYGENLGLAFQIQDDLLDTYGDSSTFGKKIGGDISEGKQTFLRITALNLANDAQREVLIQSRDYQAVRDIYDELGVAEIATEQIVSYFNSAVQYLDIFEGSAVESLKNYSDILLKRNK